MGLNEKMQSAYRRGHSTETALLKVCNDILLDTDQQRVTIMALLNLSTAFNIVHHTIFLDRLASAFDIEVSALAWMASCISNRTQKAIVNGNRSERVNLGFPQGGGAGPWAYLRYTQPVIGPTRMIQQDQLAAKHSLEHCVKSVSHWMFSNRLKLNMDKTMYNFWYTAAVV